MQKIFERMTINGQKLECFIKHTDISSGVVYQPCVAFFLDGQERRKQSMWEFTSIAVLREQAAKLEKAGANQASKGYASLADQMEKVGATDMWNLQVGLYGNEREQIESALKAVSNSRLEQAEKLIRENPQGIQYTLDAMNGIATADNDFFSYHSLHKYEGCRPKTAEFNEQDRINFNLFIDCFNWLAERKNQAEQRKREAEEAAGFYERNPHLKGLTLEEVKAKEREYDNIYNEGGEGYNPYRLPKIEPIIEPQDI